MSPGRAALASEAEASSPSPIESHRAQHIRVLHLCSSLPTRAGPEWDEAGVGRSAWPSRLGTRSPSNCNTRCRSPLGTTNRLCPDLVRSLPILRKILDSFIAKGRRGISAQSRPSVGPDRVARCARAIPCASTSGTSGRGRRPGRRRGCARSTGRVPVVGPDDGRRRRTGPRCSSRRCRLRKWRAARVSRRCFSGVTASAGSPRRRDFTSTKTTVSPSRAIRSTSPWDVR